ncbi:hypothetical protein ANN_17349 [Periplaneta americana]|uniref:Uncharacterized protein n=1 Tax=Periplaneta americana TaxID=6978 RepID=A0ABQ8SSQ3_PERAM|nr:hypothetical protein ANN_17349 [Periplaneta americana]
MSRAICVAPTHIYGEIYILMVFIYKCAESRLHITSRLYSLEKGFAAQILCKSQKGGSAHGQRTCDLVHKRKTIREPTVTGMIYLDILQNWVIYQLNEDSNDYISQEDGSPCQYHNNVREYLDQNLPQRWIGRTG